MSNWLKDTSTSYTVHNLSGLCSTLRKCVTRILPVLARLAIPAMVLGISTPNKKRISFFSTETLFLIGDLIVFSWDTYGHVAVIDSISGSTVNVVEQNGSAKYEHAYLSIARFHHTQHSLTLILVVVRATTRAKQNASLPTLNKNSLTY